MEDERRECPLCGESMRLTERKVVTRTPGTSEERTSRYFEWVCPECDYFEEKEDSAVTE